MYPLSLFLPLSVSVYLCTSLLCILFLSRPFRASDCLSHSLSVYQLVFLFSPLVSPAHFLRTHLSKFSLCSREVLPMDWVQCVCVCPLADRNECASAPCLHGKCVDIINGYQCECLAGYSGKVCETGKFVISLISTFFNEIMPQNVYPIGISFSVLRWCHRFRSVSGECCFSSYSRAHGRLSSKQSCAKPTSVITFPCHLYSEFILRMFSPFSQIFHEGHFAHT